MPYVVEASGGPSRAIPVGAPGSGLFFTAAHDLLRSQTGYRSGPLSKADRESLEASLVGRNWSNSLSSIDALERLSSATSQSPMSHGNSAFGAVHDREYSVSSSPTVTFDLFWEYKNYQTGIWAKGPLLRAAAQAFVLDNFKFPAVVRSNFEARATGMMRGMRPSKPEMELARFVGETRELPAIGRLLELKPREIASAGAGFLGYNFGIAPTVSDIQKLADTVVKSEGVLTRFAEQASRVTRRTMSIDVDSKTITVPFSFIVSGYASKTYGSSSARLNAHMGGSGTTTAAEVDFFLVATRRMRAFATFEYFVGDPDGFTGRISSYVQNAQKLLGVNLDPSTVWQLTPWTWMTDWFVDVGGLLAYQQDVADHGLVARRSGFLVEDIYSGLFTLRPYASSTKRTNFPSIAVPTTRRDQTRYRGSPYSMSANWDLSGFQWAIVGALGLTKANRVPFL